MKKLKQYSVIIFFLLFVVSFLGYADINTKSSTRISDKNFEDDRIGIILDKVERTDIYPVELKGPGYNELKFPSDGIAKPKEGWNFVVIYFTISRIEKIHMVSLGGLNREQAILYDASGHKYEVSEWKVKGLNFSDSSDIRSPMEFIEGAKGYLIFEVPKTEKPNNLTFVYYIKENLNEKSANKGQMDINLIAK